MVFYRGERMFVEYAPRSWEETCYVRICDVRVPVGPEAAGRVIDDKRTSYCVYGDLVKPIPADFHKRATRLPTVASVARAERTKAGVRDVGDEVATMLRGCDTLDSVYKAASKYLGVPVADLKDKYGHLNNGQQRMNLGNKMRFKWRKEHP